MQFSEWLADQVRKHRHASDDLSPKGCSCSTGFSDLGAWVFCCAPCMIAGRVALAEAARGYRDAQLGLEMDIVVEAPAPAPTSSLPDRA